MSPSGHEADLGRIFFADDLANGKNIIFCATGISDSALLRGRKIAGADGDHLLDPDAGEEPNGAIHSGLARSAEQDDSASLG